MPAERYTVRASHPQGHHVSESHEKREHAEKRRDQLKANGYADARVETEQPAAGAEPKPPTK